MRSAFAVLLLLLQSACICNGGCADCCSGPGTQPYVVSCRVLFADGGAAPGLGVRCEAAADGGVTTTSTGDFLFTATMRTCGIAAGSNDCGFVSFTTPDGGALSVTFMGSTDPSVYSDRLTGTGCSLTVR